MLNQHAKWPNVCNETPRRRPIASFNYFLSSARLAAGPQRFQPPGSWGSIDHVVNKKAGVIRVYLPPDANCLQAWSPTNCPAGRNYVNIVVAGKQPAPQWLDDGPGCQVIAPAGLGIWEWASNDKGGEPDVVMAWPRRRADPRDAGGRRADPPAPAGAEESASSTP